MIDSPCICQSRTNDNFIYRLIWSTTIFEWMRNGILLPKLFWPTVRKNCSSDREKLLKFEAESREWQKKYATPFLSCDLKNFTNSQLSALNFKSFFSITGTIFSHRRSEIFWKQNTIFSEYNFFEFIGIGFTFYASSTALSYLHIEIMALIESEIRDSLLILVSCCTDPCN